ncbi:MAG: hypothetical protein QXQ40_02575 [Candidatus Aenigmatarchaeota archaeon]
MQTHRRRCPYWQTCEKYSDCPDDFEACAIFKRKEAEKNIKPIRWKPGATY